LPLIMRPIKEFPPARARALRYLLTDIDDTLTLDGRIPAEAFAAMAQLRAAGLTVVPVTGRPAGWCDHIARMWPVDGVVGENGAFYFQYDDTARTMRRRYWQDAATRAADRRRLAEIEARVLAEVPGAAVAADQAYREADLAIDFREDVAPLDDAAVARIVAIFEAAGAHAKVSSIHVNGWFGDYDKLTMTRRMFDESFGVDLDAVRDATVFVGDSPNDAPMFAYFPDAVGVANVADFAGRLDAEPAWVTRARGGHGFAELAEALLAARRSS
jgi:HAD superfamily hydrolase (TIGR01484 family)